MPRGVPNIFRSTDQRRQILAALATHGPMGWADVAQHVSLSLEAVRSALWRMQSARHQTNGIALVHIHSWARSHGPTSPWTPVFALGPGDNAPRPGKTQRPMRGRKTRRDDVIRALQELRHATVAEVAKYAGIPDATAWKHVKDLRLEGKLHIYAWKRSTGTRGAMARRWALGPGEDRPAPHVLSVAERNRTYNRRSGRSKQLRQGVSRAFNPWAGLVSV